MSGHLCARSERALLMSCVAACSFLDDVERIATRTYEPTDDDVVRARFRTLGVQEYSLTFENTGEASPTLYLIAVDCILSRVSGRTAC